MKSKEILPEIITNTKGPWFAVEYAGYHVLQTEDRYNDKGDLFNEDDYPNAYNNAFLASKAPELLAALQIAELEIEEKERFINSIADQLTALKEVTVTTLESKDKEIAELKEKNEELKEANPERLDTIRSLKEDNALYLSEIKSLKTDNEVLKQQLKDCQEAAANKDVPRETNAINNNICNDCWGSGWEIRFIKPCTECNGKGKKPQINFVK